MDNISYINLRNIDTKTDKILLTQFYDNFLKVYFTNENQLESLEKLNTALYNFSDLTNPVMTIILAVNHNQTIGGIVFEFYPISQYGLISYFCVSSEFRRLNIGKQLIEQAEKELNNFGCKRIFLEINSPFKCKEDTFSPMKRVKVFNKLNCSLVNTVYIQPPLLENLKPDESLLLICINKNKDKYLNGDHLAVFLYELWTNSIGYDNITSNELFNSMICRLYNKNIKLSPLTMDNIKKQQNSFIVRSNDAIQILSKL